MAYMLSSKNIGIPSNDDTPKLIEFYLTLFQQTILSGKEKRREKDSSN